MYDARFSGSLAALEGLGVAEYNLNDQGFGKVCVLLAAHNGEDYLPLQIKSLADQVHSDFCILAVDDASVDGTKAILDSAEQRYGVRLEAAFSNTETLGVVGAYSRLGILAGSTDTEYFAFCDQDDIWDPRKLCEQLYLIRELEKKDPGKAVMVYCESSLIDAAGNPIGTTLSKAMDVREPDPENALRALVRFNYIPGNTMVFNRKLLELAFPLPPEAQMHDWWVALVAAAFGRIGRVDKPLIFYRQHQSNVIGVKTVLDSAFRSLSSWSIMDKEYCAAFEQAFVLCNIQQNSDKMSLSDEAFIMGFSKLPFLDHGARVKWLLTASLAHPNFAAKLMFLLRTFFIKCGRDDKY